MSQGSQSVADNPGAVVRAAINTELAALYSNSSGPTAPSVTVAEMFWFDTTTNLFKIRDAANANWVVMGGIDQTNKIWMQPGFGGNASIASASTVDLASSNAATITITGTTTITSFGSNMKAGQTKIIDTPSGLSITYNATSMLTPKGASLKMNAGDAALVTCVGSGNYRVTPLLISVPYTTIAQRLVASTNTASTGTTQIPWDNTIPQNTEGDQYLSQAITPQATTNKLFIEAVVYVSSSITSNFQFIAALFQDSTANALAAANITCSATTNTGIYMLHLRWYMDAGTTSATTFKLRVGANTAGTTTFNGSNGGQMFGGALLSYLSITEFMP